VGKKRREEGTYPSKRRSRKRIKGGGGPRGFEEKVEGVGVAQA